MGNAVDLVLFSQTSYVNATVIRSSEAKGGRSHHSIRIEWSAIFKTNLPQKVLDHAFEPELKEPQILKTKRLIIKLAINHQFLF